MVFNAMTDANMPTSRAVIAQSKSYSMSDMQSVIPPTDVSCITLNDSSASMTHICESHFGECPVSFRSMLKRYVTVAAATNSALTWTTSYGTLKATAPIIPDNNFKYDATSVFNSDLFSYLRYAYLGLRGSVRYRFRWITSYSPRMFDRSTITIEPASSSAITLSVSAASDATPPSSTTIYKATTRGVVMFHGGFNPGLEFELPMYTNNLFLFSFTNSLDDSGSNDNMEQLWFRNFSVNTDIASTTLSIAQAVLEVASGEDFGFLRYQGAPFYAGGIVS
jgi:hypothetical protein